MGAKVKDTTQNKKFFKRQKSRTNSTKYNGKRNRNILVTKINALTRQIKGGDFRLQSFKNSFTCWLQ